MRFENGWAVSNDALQPFCDLLPNDSNVWIGYSLGGMRLLGELCGDENLGDHAVKPDALILISSCLSFCQRDAAPYGTPVAQLRGIRSGLGRDPDKVLATFAKHCFAPERPPAWETVMQQDVDDLVAGANELIERDYTSVPAAVFAKLPALILHGSDDVVISPEAAVALGKAFGTTPNFADGAGHALPITHPEWCAERITQFLKR